MHPTSFFTDPPCPSQPPVSVLRCLQTNLRHSRSVAASLAEVCLENKLDIVLIQKPYAIGSLTPRVSDVLPGYVAFHALDRDHAYGAVILVRLALAIEGRAVSRCSSNSAAAVDLQLPCGRCRFISMYVRPSNPDSLSLFRSSIVTLSQLQRQEPSVEQRTHGQKGCGS